MWICPRSLWIIEGCSIILLGLDWKETILFNTVFQNTNKLSDFQLMVQQEKVPNSLTWVVRWNTRCCHLHRCVCSDSHRSIHRLADKQAHGIDNRELQFISSEMKNIIKSFRFKSIFWVNESACIPCVSPALGRSHTDCGQQLPFLFTTTQPSAAVTAGQLHVRTKSSFKVVTSMRHTT